MERVRKLEFPFRNLMNFVVQKMDTSIKTFYRVALLERRRGGGSGPAVKGWVLTGPGVRGAAQTLTHAPLPPTPTPLPDSGADCSQPAPCRVLL